MSADFDRVAVDVLLSEYQRAVVRFDRERLAKRLAAVLPAVLQRVDDLTKQLTEARAEALREAASEVHAEARWQQECTQRRISPLRCGESHVGRLLMVERIILDRVPVVAVLTERNPADA